MYKKKQGIKETATENANPNTVETMKCEDTGEVQYVYDESQMILGEPDDFNNITDLVLEDGTRAMIVNGTLVTADGHTLILQDGSDLSQYYVDENTDHILLSQEQEEQFLEITSPQNQDTPTIQDGRQQVLYIHEGDQVLPVQVQEQYQLAEVNSGNAGVPMQVVKLENEGVIEGIDGVIDLEQFLNQQGMVQLESGNYQYAVLKDGKFHIQTMNEPTHPELLKDQKSRNVEAETILGPAADVSYLDLSTIKGKDMNTGEPLSLSKYMNKVYTRNKKKELNAKKESSKIKCQEKYKINNTFNSTTVDLKKLINKKITIGKTNKGKLLVGKIINITKKTQASTHIFDSDQNRLRRNIFKKKIVLPSSQRPKNVAVKEVINLVDDENTKISKSSDKSNLQSENFCARTKNPKISAVSPVESADQSNDDSLIIVTSANSDSTQTTNVGVTSILNSTIKSSVTHTSKTTSIQENRTPSSTMATGKKEELLSPIKNKKDFVRILNSASVENSSEQSKICVHKKVVTKDCFEVIMRTLTGLMNMESVVKKLKSKTIIIKIIEKNYNQLIQDYTKTISYCTGYMVREYKLDEEANNFSESWRFIPDTNSQDTILGEDNLESVLQDRTSGQNNLKNIANLTIQITINPQGSRTTRVIINPPNMYKCKDCTKSFRTSSALKVHTNECQSPYSLECTACSIKFKNSQEFKDHLPIHQTDDNKGMYECMECNKRFMSSLLLRKHMDIHFKPVNCRHCNQGFSNMRELKKHLPVHEPAIPEPPAVPVEIIEVPQEVVLANAKQHEQKIYGCYICGRQFTRHSNLQRHIEIHKGEGAMYKCAICNCSYHYVSSLTRHVVTCHVDTTNKRTQKISKPRESVESNANSEFQFLQEDQIVEMIRLEDMSAENLQYVTETMGNVTESLNIGEGVEVLQIPVDESSIIIED